MSPRTASELRTIARALDELGVGGLGAVGDVLVQRFKALEASLRDGSWNVAKRLELVQHDAGLVSLNEQRVAAREEILAGKLRDTVKKGSGV